MIDGANPPCIKSLKINLGERSDYENEKRKSSRNT
jgi:hypothetical protein